jgi:hypothetical protein
LQLAISNSDGREIWKNIVIPICKGWQDEEVFKDFTKHVMVLQPNTFPEALLWSGYTLMHMIVTVYKKFHSPIASGNTSTSEQQYLVELVATLERPLTFVYTGSARSLS